MKLPLVKKSLYGIDLLPESVQHPKRIRKLAVRLAAAQVAIFLCLGLVILGLHILQNRAWDESHRLNVRINYLRHGPEVTALAYARDIHMQLMAAEAFLEVNMPPDFDPAWVLAILEADTGYMTSLDYAGDFIMLTGITDYMEKIENHRQSLLDTEVFNAVNLGRISLQEDGRLYYELRIVIRR